MGRKRTSKKKALNLWVDEEIIDQMRQLEMNPSAFFSKHAKEYLKQHEKSLNDDNCDETTE